MAITVLQQPQLYQPVYNQIMLVAESDKTAETRFSYVVYVTPNGGTVSRLVVAPDPDGRLIIDIHKHLEAIVSYDLPIGSTTVGIVPSNIYGSYTFDIDEQYEVASVLTEFAGYSASSKGVWNGAIGWVEQQDYKWSDYSTDSDGTMQLLTSLPSTGFNIDLATRMYLTLPAVTELFTTLDARIEIRAYDSAGLDWSEDLDNTEMSQSELQLGLGPENINTATDLSGNQIDADTTYYTVQVVVDAGTDPARDGLFYNVLRTSATTASFTINDTSTLKVGDVVTLTGYTPADWNASYNITDVSYYPQTGGYICSMEKIAGTLTSDPTVTGDLASAYAGITSPLYRFDVNTNCSKYQKYNLIFLDRLGSFIPVSFDLVSTKSVRVKKTSFRQNVGSFQGDRFSYATSDRGQTRLNTDVDEIISLNSNWLNEEMSALIDEMIASPEVYHYDGDGNLFAINITTNSYQVYNKTNEKLYNHKIDFTYSFKNPQQN